MRSIGFLPTLLALSACSGSKDGDQEAGDGSTPADTSSPDAEADADTDSDTDADADADADADTDADTDADADTDKPGEPCKGQELGVTVGLCGPDFTLTDANGAAVSLYDFYGQVILLDISGFT